MISDTLSDAVREIREYQEDFPEVYAGLKAEIDLVLELMDALRATLDEPPLSRKSGEKAKAEGR